MLAELFKAICEKAVAAAGVSIVDDPERENGKLFIDPNGKIVHKAAPLCFPYVVCSTLDAMFAIGNQWADAGDDVSVWYSSNYIGLTTGATLDAGGVATFRLQRTAAARLLSVDKVEWLAHADMVRRLRLELLELGLGQLAVDLRAVEWLAGQRTASESARGRDTLGKSVDAAVARVDELPEQLTVPMRAWSDLPIGAPTILKFEIDPAAQRFALYWHPDRRRGWEMETLGALRDYLTEMCPWATAIAAASPGVRTLGDVSFERTRGE